MQTAARSIMQRHFRLSVLLMLLALLLAGCQSIPRSKPLPPDVEIESIRAVKMSLSSQQLAFRLKVGNPNDYDLPLQYLNFVAALDGKELAQGVSNERVNLPAHEDATIEIMVNTRINKLLGQLLLATDNNEREIAYDVRGFVKLSNWPTRIPFNVDGLVDNPALQ
ncbi:LEA type 2 family protein [Granulosicoccus sp. 3-233]|uniref:LEA type 2 family protein n=1 Tax=Granulosicoccus sp. 3-233 TaxID=3417969 RepID=UPI003D3419F9